MGKVESLQKVQRRDNNRVFFLILSIGLCILFLGGHYGLLEHFSSLNHNDVEISGFKWCEYEIYPDRSSYCTERPPLFYSNGLRGKGVLDIYSSRELYAKIYVNGEMAHGPDLYSLRPGENKIYLYDIKMRSLYEDIAVRVCFSKSKEAFSSSPWTPEKGIICKEAYFSPPRLSVSVSPSTVKFTIKRDNDSIVDRSVQNITILNTGDVPIRYTVLVPDFSRYTYYDKSFDSDNILIPGKPEKYEIEVVIWNDTPPGVYYSTGYIVSLWEYGNISNNYFMQPFTIITQIT